MFDSLKFWAEYRKRFGHDPHGIEKPATEGLLGFLATDPQIERVEWAAYLLATIRNECGTNMMPIKEIKAKSGSKVWIQWQSKYWGTGFYGRGYSQLTFEGNYRQFSELLYHDDRLVKNPDLVLDPAVGYKILATGCVRGMFRSRKNGARYKLADFLNDTEKDYVDARQIVNGVSGDAWAHALRVGEYAKKYEACLRASQVETQPQAPQTPGIGTFSPVKGQFDLRVRLIQNALLLRKFTLPKFGADGKWGDETVFALVAFQASVNLPHTGLPNAETLKALGL